MWRGGCIIRSAFLGDIKKAFVRKPDLINLLLDKFFKSAVGKRQTSWRRVIVQATKLGIPVPCLGSALTYFDGYPRRAPAATCCRRSATSSGRIRTSAWTNRVVSSCTPTGPAWRHDDFAVV